MLLHPCDFRSERRHSGSPSDCWESYRIRDPEFHSGKEQIQCVKPIYLGAVRISVPEELSGAFLMDQALQSKQTDQCPVAPTELDDDLGLGLPPTTLLMVE